MRVFRSVGTAFGASCAHPCTTSWPMRCLAGTSASGRGAVVVPCAASSGRKEKPKQTGGGTAGAGGSGSKKAVGGEGSRAVEYSTADAIIDSNIDIDGYDRNHTFYRGQWVGDSDRAAPRGDRYWEGWSAERLLADGWKVVGEDGEDEEEQQPAAARPRSKRTYTTRSTVSSATKLRARAAADAAQLSVPPINQPPTKTDAGTEGAGSNPGEAQGVTDEGKGTRKGSDGETAVAEGKLPTQRGRQRISSPAAGPAAAPAGGSGSGRDRKGESRAAQERVEEVVADGGAPPEGLRNRRQPLFGNTAAAAITATSATTAAAAINATAATAISATSAASPAPGGAGVSDPRAPRRPAPGPVYVLWDLDNKYPVTLNHEQVVENIRRELRPYGKVVEIRAYCNYHTLNHVPELWDEALGAGMQHPLQPTATDALVCPLCGNRFKEESKLKKHFAQLHQREHQKRLAHRPAAKKYVQTAKYERYGAAVKEVLPRKRGFNLEGILKAAGVLVTPVQMGPQTADVALERDATELLKRVKVSSSAQLQQPQQQQQQHAPSPPVLVLISDDRGFAPLLKLFGQRGWRTVLVCSKGPLAEEREVAGGDGSAGTVRLSWAQVAGFDS